VVLLQCIEGRNTERPCTRTGIRPGMPAPAGWCGRSIASDAGGEGDSPACGRTVRPAVGPEARRAGPRCCSKKDVFFEAETGCGAGGVCFFAKRPVKRRFSGIPAAAKFFFKNRLTGRSFSDIFNSSTGCQAEGRALKKIIIAGLDSGKRKS